jgi:hypothetical protein
MVAISAALAYNTILRYVRCLPALHIKKMQHFIITENHKQK